MALERGRKASSVDRALDEWRREAVESRERISVLVDQLGEVRAIVLDALQALAGTGQDTQVARIRLMDAIKALAIRGPRK